MAGQPVRWGAPMIYVFGLYGGLLAFSAYRALAKLGLEGVRPYPDIELISYRDLLSKESHRFFEGAYILTDLDRLGGRQRERLAYILEQVRQSPIDVEILNHPLSFPTRYELLRRLHEDGTNDHNVYRLTEHRAPARWPVFVRQELGHWHSPLLHDPDALAAFLESMDRDGIWRGDKLIVEFNDTRQPDGYFRRDSAFRIGDHIVPWRIHLARHWWLRSAQLDPADLLEESALTEARLAYVRDNPDAAVLMEIFERAKIRYGRIDYSFKDGRIQVWEINGTPNLPRRVDFEAPPADQAVMRAIIERLNAAFAALDSRWTG